MPSTNPAKAKPTIRKSCRVDAPDTPSHHDEERPQRWYRCGTRPYPVKLATREKCWIFLRILPDQTPQEFDLGPHSPDRQFRLFSSYGNAPRSEPERFPSSEDKSCEVRTWLMTLQS
jgi:hypothetical protein